MFKLNYYTVCKYKLNMTRVRARCITDHQPKKRIARLSYLLTGEHNADAVALWLMVLYLGKAPRAMFATEHCRGKFDKCWIWLVLIDLYRRSRQQGVRMSVAIRPAAAANQWVLWWDRQVRESILLVCIYDPSFPSRSWKRSDVLLLRNSGKPKRLLVQAPICRIHPTYSAT